MPALVLPAEAVLAVREALSRTWSEQICAQLDGRQITGIAIALRPGITRAAQVDSYGIPAWHSWHQQWRRFAADLPAGVQVVYQALTLHGVPGEYPRRLQCDLDGALALAADAGPAPVDLTRARRVGADLVALGARLTPATLRQACALAPHDLQVLHQTLTWLREQPELGAWSERQLPIPGRHTKWLRTHGRLVHSLTGRDVRAQVRARPAVVHVTYVDPDHLRAGLRRHDAWTSGDCHELAYRPQVVLVVENRDSRLWFPSVPDTVVVEGGGKAAAALLSEVPWIRSARHVVYWGDLDVDGYHILDLLRAALAEPDAAGNPGRPVQSLCMDGVDLQRYARFGVQHDRSGRLLPGSDVLLPHLTDAERQGYDTLATAGSTAVRRIEQEMLPLPEVAARLLALLADRN